MRGAERLLPDREGAIVERLRLGVAAQCLVQPSEVVEARSDVRMLRAERLLPNSEGALVKRLRLGVVAQRLPQIGEAVEARGAGPVLSAAGPFPDPPPPARPCLPPRPVPP